jgi:hypothetical protein
MMIALSLGRQHQHRHGVRRPPRPLGFTSFGAAAFLNAALHGGASTNATSRTINNNLVPVGVEIATASYNSTYVSPEIKYGVNLPL